MEYSREQLPEQYGFVNAPTASLVSKTILLDELQALLNTSNPNATYDELKDLAIVHNYVQKNSLSGRDNTFRRLREFYGLSNDLCVYRAMRLLWSLTPAEQPMLAMLCANARNPILRYSAHVVLSTPQGTVLTKEHLLAEMQSFFPSSYSDYSREVSVIKILGSWSLSGHLLGRAKKIRTKPVAGPVSTSYALYLGYLADKRGDALFDTIWTSILDRSQADLHEFAREASARGWITYKSAGGITDVEFPGFMCQNH